MLAGLLKGFGQFGEGFWKEKTDEKTKKNTETYIALFILLRSPIFYLLVRRFFIVFPYFFQPAVALKEQPDQQTDDLNSWSRFQLQNDSEIAKLFAGRKSCLVYDQFFRGIP